MQVFHAKYLGPTNHRGSRIKVSTLKWGQKIESKMIPYPYHVSDMDIYRHAVSEYLGSTCGNKWESIQLAPCEYLVLMGDEAQGHA